MTLALKKAMIADALVARKGIGYILETAAKVTGNPMFIIDTSLKLIAKSQTVAELQELWSSLEGFEQARLTIARTVEQAGIYEHLLHYDTPIYGEFEFSPVRMLGCRIRDKLQAIAFICMFEVVPFNPEDEELLVYLCKILYYDMLYAEETAMQKNPVYSIVSDLLEESITCSELLNRAIYAQLNIPSKIRLVVLDYEKSKIGVSIYYLHRVLTEHLQPVFSVIYHEQLLIALDEQKWGQDIRELIFEYINDYPIRMATTYPFDDMLNLKQAFIQTQSALRIGLFKQPDQRFLSYDDFALQDFLAGAAGCITLEKYIHPWIAILQKYDKDQDTELAKTLLCYLENHKSPGITAKKLYIHRSTLYPRLEKIADLLRIHDLNEIQDDLFLRLSFAISDYVS